MNLYHDWLQAKAAEREATERRRAIEDEMVRDFCLPESLDGTRTHKDGGYKIKVVGRINRSVDSELLQEIATEHGLTDHLPELFRWKPEINAKAWEAADPAITQPLLAAITSKPGRPSFSITRED